MATEANYQTSKLKINIAQPFIYQLCTEIKQIIADMNCTNDSRILQKMQLQKNPKNL